MSSRVQLRPRTQPRVLLAIHVYCSLGQEHWMEKRGGGKGRRESPRLISTPLAAVYWHNHLPHPLFLGQTKAEKIRVP
ncbi:hypothetical protein M0802_012536 [Mischocyttarus mexicanus]|nr:hypothetical protein M0802_012536 [Mischocyttarus mexicanus]